MGVVTFEEHAGMRAALGCSLMCYRLLYKANKCFKSPHNTPKSRKWWAQIAVCVIYPKFQKTLNEWAQSVQVAAPGGVTLTPACQMALTVASPFLVHWPLWHCWESVCVCVYLLEWVCVCVCVCVCVHVYVNVTLKALSGHASLSKAQAIWCPLSESFYLACFDETSEILYVGGQASTAKVRSQQCRFPIWSKSWLIHTM